MAGLLLIRRGVEVIGYLVVRCGARAKVDTGGICKIEVYLAQMTIVEWNDSLVVVEAEASDCVGFFQNSQDVYLILLPSVSEFEGVFLRGEFMYRKYTILGTTDSPESTVYATFLTRSRVAFLSRRSKLKVNVPSLKVEFP